MRAVQAGSFGGPGVLEMVEVEEPSAGAGEVLVEVAAAEVLFLDTQLRAGWGQEYFGLVPPFIPGAGVAGVVAAVGDGVDPTLVGRRVIAGTGGVGTYVGGGYAEKAVVPAAEVFLVPDGLRLTTALAALHDGATALEQVDVAKVVAGERVLVNGASGSLGNWLVPLLAETGATVIAAARGELKLAHARELGADQTVDYSKAGWTKELEPVDVVFDGAGGEIGRAAFDLTVSGGRFLAYGAASGDFAQVDPEERGISLVGIYQPDPVEWRRLPARALEVLAAGQVRPTVGQLFVLERAADAHTAIEARRTLGKTVLISGSR